MNSTLKIILALKLKFLLIVLSVGGSFLIEGKLAKDKAIQNIKEVVLFERMDKSDTIANMEANDTRKSSYVVDKISCADPDAGQAYIINCLTIEIEL